MTDSPFSPATWTAGFRAGLPLTLGVAPFAVAFGLGAREAGLGVLGIGAMSVFVLAGSAQFLAVALLKAGASAPQIWLATLFLNSRHLLMSMALLPRLVDRPLWLRAILAHMIVDEVFAVVSREPRGGAAYLLGAETAICGAWVVGTLVGATLGADLPPALTEAAGFSHPAHPGAPSLAPRPVPPGAGMGCPPSRGWDAPRYRRPVVAPLVEHALRTARVA